MGLHASWACIYSLPLLPSIYITNWLEEVVEAKLRHFYSSYIIVIQACDSYDF